MLNINRTMKKIVSVFLCLNTLSSNFILAQVLEDNLAKQLNQNLKIEKIKYQKIEDEFIPKTLNTDLKAQKGNVQLFNDELLQYLDKDLKIQKHKQESIKDPLVEKIDKIKISTKNKQILDLNFDGVKIKVSPQKYHTTRKKLYEGAYIDFILVEDAKIKNKIYKKGELIKARVETLSLNGARGIPADLVVGNFTLDNLILNGQIECRGANRALWVYPLGCTLTCFLFIGLPIFAIRGGHAKLKPSKVYEIEI